MCSSDLQDRLLRLAGLLLREALVGIKNLARTQREIRQNSGLRSTADDPERIALQNLPVEDDDAIHYSVCDSIAEITRHLNPGMLYYFASRVLCRGSSADAVCRCASRSIRL